MQFVALVSVYFYTKQALFLFFYSCEVRKVEENQETSEKVENIPAESPGTDEQTDPVEEAKPETPQELPALETPKEEAVESFETQILENPQLYSTNYLTDDYAITLIHEFTLGYVLVSTLVCVLIIVQVLKAVLGGGRSW